MRLGRCPECLKMLTCYPWCPTKLGIKDPPRKDRKPVIPLESYETAKARAQKGRAMQNVGKVLKNAPGRWDIPIGHEAVKRGGGYVIQEAAKKPWESDREFERRKKAAHGKNM